MMKFLADLTASLSAEYRCERRAVLSKIVSGSNLLSILANAASVNGAT
jgi:hypothetical protein